MTTISYDTPFSGLHEGRWSRFQSHGGCATSCRVCPMQTMNNLVGRGNIRTALLIGGESMQKQLRQLGNRSRIIVGTPGRVYDMLKNRFIKPENLKIFLNA